MTKKKHSSGSTPSKSNDDSVPCSEALMILLSPDGYYTYLGITKSDKVKEDVVKKNYRKLSLKHHPDRKGGDQDTFRALNRAQHVLLHEKLKHQYDILGLDLEEDEEHHDHHEDGGNDKTEGETPPPSTPDGIISHMASMTLAAILQSLVRTAVLGLVSVFLVRWRFTVFPALAFLAFVAYRVRTVQGASKSEMISPLMIATGLLLMYQGRSPPDYDWSFTFWTGEGLVATMFTYNSLPPQNTPIFFVLVAMVCYLLMLWLRGDLWKYLTLIALQVILAVILALLFPIMEMLLEAILNEKLRKVGDKVRAHNMRMEAYYKQSRKQ